MRARSNTLSVPHQIYAVGSLLVAEVPRTAVGGSRAPRQVADFCELTGLIEPARSLLSYCLTDNQVLYTSEVFVDSRDLKC